MTIAIDRLKEVTRDFGRRHIAYQMARELLEIYSGNGPLVWNALSDFPPEVNGKYLVITSYGDIRSACYTANQGNGGLQMAPLPELSNGWICQPPSRR